MPILLCVRVKTLVVAPAKKYRKVISFFAYSFSLNPLGSNLYVNVHGIVACHSCCESYIKVQCMHLIPDFHDTWTLSVGSGFISWTPVISGINCALWSFKKSKIMMLCLYFAVLVFTIYLNQQEMLECWFVPRVYWQDKFLWYWKAWILSLNKPFHHDTCSGACH